MTTGWMDGLMEIITDAMMLIVHVVCYQVVVSAIFRPIVTMKAALKLFPNHFHSLATKLSTIDRALEVRMDSSSKALLFVIFEASLAMIVHSNSKLPPVEFIDSMGTLSTTNFIFKKVRI